MEFDFTERARALGRARLALGLACVLLVPTPGCFRSSTSSGYAHAAGSSTVSSGPVRARAQTHSVAQGRGVLFDAQTGVQGGFEHRVVLLMLSTQDFWYTIDPNSEFGPAPDGLGSTELALQHADFEFQGFAGQSSYMMPTTTGSPYMTATPVVPAAPAGSVATTSTSTTSAGGTPAPVVFDPNRVTVRVPFDAQDTSAPAGEPSLVYRGEQLPAPDGAVFLVLLSGVGPSKPTRIASTQDLALASSDPEGFVRRLFEEEPLLRELLDGDN